jgi:hypothetical protein
VIVRRQLKRRYVLAWLFRIRRRWSERWRRAMLLEREKRLKDDLFWI